MKNFLLWLRSFFDRNDRVSQQTPQQTLLSEIRFRTIFENAPVMIDSFTPQGKALLWNKACEQILGYSRDELNQAVNIMELFYPDSQVREQVLDAISHQDGRFREFVVRRKDGVFLRQMWANFPQPEGHTIGVGYDVTAIRQVEEELKRSNQNLEQKVEERSRQLDEQRAQLISSSKLSALGEMAGGIAHEINTPLATIVLLSEQLQQVLGGHRMSEPIDTAAALRMANKIEVTAQRIAGIIHALRNFSRDGSRDAFETTTLQKIIDETILLCAEKLKHGNIDLKVDPCPPDLIVECRPVEISQILLNLLQNAYDAVERLSEKWIHIQIADHGSSVQISISDSGPGIGADIQEKLFQPFFTTKETGKGTGLGLGISKRIAERHHGSLRLDSTQPRTCFVVELPKNQPKSS
jgi:PAS domain S-box-containing protein